ncbi:unnamed protein product [Mucor hiemalis]
MTTVVEEKKKKLTGSQDLLTYFNLIPIYNKVVKPFPLPDRAAGLILHYFLIFQTYLVNWISSQTDIYAETLKDAFSLKEGPVPGFDASIFGTDNGGNASSSNSNQYLGGERAHYDALAGDVNQNGERRHKKKKKKRKHGHEHDEEGHHGDHRKKKKKKKDRERKEEYIGSSM